jgi:hypothetical protein
LEFLWRRDVWFGKNFDQALLRWKQIDLEKHALTIGDSKTAAGTGRLIQGLTLFHRHQQLHMEFDFMTLFDYVQEIRAQETASSEKSVRALALFNEGIG